MWHLQGPRQSPTTPTSSVRLRRLLTDGDEALSRELEELDVCRENELRLVELRDVLRHPLIRVRRYESGFFHPKAFVAQAADGTAEALVGSCNLTRAGLHSNVELAIVADRDAASATAARVRAWWRAAKPYDLAGLIEERFTAHPAALVYLRMLTERYADEADPGTSPLGLTWFQSVGVAKAAAVLERHGGVLVADEVGLGKTFIAGELMRRSERGDLGQVLILCPAHLRRTVWLRRVREWNLPGEVLSYHQFRRQAEKTREAGGPWPQYRMIVCDEAHYLRNPSSATREAFDEPLRKHVRRPRMVLLTATPVNNRGTDLAELLDIAAPRPSQTSRRSGAGLPGQGGG
ncbi:SNF2-related protein [Streptomyces sp. cg2]|uniref:SNF2-related protein n=1 Tax=Streptomyces sp. cg2 TaxID=3238799 RepID=UPI0034E28914